MPEWMWMAVVAMFVIDAVVLALVLRQRARRAGLDVTKLHETSKLVHERIGDHMRANFSGNVEDLPRALRGLMPVVEQTLRSQDQQIDAATVRLAVVMSVTGHRFATRSQVEAAMAEVPAGEIERAA